MTYPNYPTGTDPVSDKPRFDRRRWVVMAVVVVVCATAYRGLYGWHRVDDPENWRYFAVAGVLAALSLWFGWFGFAITGSLTAVIAMTVMVSIDGSTLSHVDGVNLWPAAAIQAAVVTTVEVFAVATLAGGLRRWFHRTP
jgi:hypothetical protein